MLAHLLREVSLKSDSLLVMEALEIAISGIGLERVERGRRSVDRVLAQAPSLLEVRKVSALDAFIFGIVSAHRYELRASNHCLGGRALSSMRCCLSGIVTSRSPATAASFSVETRRYMQAPQSEHVPRIVGSASRRGLWRPAPKAVELARAATLSFLLAPGV